MDQPLTAAQASTNSVSETTAGTRSNAEHASDVPASGTVGSAEDDATLHVGQRNGRSRRAKRSTGTIVDRIPPGTVDNNEAPEEQYSGQEGQEGQEVLATPLDKLSHTTQQKLSSIRHGASRYVTTEEVGRGGCGIVERARDQQLDREVVVKRIIDKYSAYDEIVERFINEARITGQLEHPGIVPVYELGIDAAGVPYYAMKQVRGVTLAAKIKEVHAVEDHRAFKQQLSQLLQRFLDVCQTLAFAHQAGVIHRDLKPANVMIGEFGETILLDWGLARRLRSEAGLVEDDPQEQTVVAGKANSERRSGNARTANSRTAAELASDQRSASDMTRQGMVLGTAAYMAPEQALGLNDRVNEQSDVFALGVMLYEILSGVSPFRSDSLETTMQRVVHCDYRPLSKLGRGRPRLPRPLLAICEHAMQREQSLRYCDARALAADLQSFLSGGSVSVYSESLWERFDRKAERHRGVFRAVFMACLLVTAVSLVAGGKIIRSHQAERVARLQAVDAHAEAHAALVAEREAREETQQQLMASREAADTWLVGLSGDLQFYPGLQGLRQSLITQARAHYDELLHSAERQLEETPTGDDSQIREREDWIRAVTEVAACRLRLGDLLRLGGDMNLASAQYSAAIDIVEKASVGKEDTLIPGLMLQVANAIIGLSLIELERDEPASTTRARDLSTSGGGAATVQKAIDIASELLKRDPGMVEARSALARALVIDARGLAGGSEPQAAAVQLERALATTDILAEQADSIKVQKLKRTILEDRARILYRAADYVGASRACHDLIRFLDQLHAEHPNRPDLLEGRAVANSLLAAVNINNAFPSEAVAACEASGTDLESAWELLFGEPYYRENLAVIAANRAASLEMLGQRQSAADAWRASIAELRWLLQSDGVTNQRAWNVANSYLSLARLLGDDPGADPQSGTEVTRLLEQSDVLIAHLEEQQYLEVEELRLRLSMLQTEVELGSGELEAAEKRLSSVEARIRDAASRSASRLTGVARAMVEVRATLLRKKIELMREPQAGLDAAWIVADELRAYPLAQHVAYDGMLELWGAQGERREGTRGSVPAQRAALDWVAAQQGSPEAWSWLAAWSAAIGDWETAERARRRAVQLRHGMASVDEDLVGALIALQHDAARGELLQAAAVERADRELSKSSRRRILLELLAEFASPVP